MPKVSTASRNAAIQPRDAEPYAHELPTAQPMTTRATHQLPDPARAMREIREAVSG
ncbi:hypothetical protein [Streptomyces acidiscabies]|uniref:hypothetical protein n=1 Tax=Streptomyces acidiscabies TaxID=42234 RepID=UPI0015BC0124|nr:hypothetical protein [Streptomyces acidiscabies]